MSRSSMNRREFGKLVGSVGLSGVGAGAGAGAAQEAAEARAPGSGADAYTFFTADEAAFVEAAIDHLIPADELGPGAREAGVAVFIDRQLAGAFGAAAKWYMQGPWGESLPEQGYQRPLTPRELYRLAIGAVNAICRERFGERFDRIESERQLDLLKEAEQGDLGDPETPMAAFFSLLLENTMEGFFADPIYGGNRDKVGWRLVGFPGVGAAYRNRVERYGEPYEVEPVSIQDVIDRRARVDENGHVEHELLPKL